MKRLTHNTSAEQKLETSDLSELELRSRLLWLAHTQSSESLKCVCPFGSTQRIRLNGNGCEWWNFSVPSRLPHASNSHRTTTRIYTKANDEAFPTYSMGHTVWYMHGLYGIAHMKSSDRWSPAPFQPISYIYNTYTHTHIYDSISHAKAIVLVNLDTVCSQYICCIQPQSAKLTDVIVCLAHHPTTSPISAHGSYSILFVSAPFFLFGCYYSYSR